MNLGLDAKTLKQKDANYLFIDFKKAFDSIDHKILKEKIENKIVQNKMKLETGILLK